MASNEIHVISNAIKYEFPLVKKTEEISQIFAMHKVDAGTSYKACIELVTKMCLRLQM